MLLYGAPKRPVEDFLPRLNSFIDGVDQDLTMAHLMDSVIQFCDDSKLIRHTDCIVIEPCTNSYLLSIDDNERLAEVLSFRATTTDCHISLNHVNYYVEGNTLYVEPHTVLSMPTEVEITYSVAPKRDSFMVYDEIYENWLEPIINLTLATLFIMPSMEWVNPNLSAQYRALYNQQLSKALTRIVTKHRALNIRLRSSRRVK